MSKYTNVLLGVAGGISFSTPGLGGGGRAGTRYTRRLRPWWHPRFSSTTPSGFCAPLRFQWTHATADSAGWLSIPCDWKGQVKLFTSKSSGKMPVHRGVVTRSDQHAGVNPNSANDGILANTAFFGVEPHRVNSSSVPLDRSRPCVAVAAASAL